jgi:hypothetical protein
MTLASVNDQYVLDQHDAVILRKYFLNVSAKPATFDLTTVDGGEFVLHVRPDGLQRRVLVSAGLRLPGHEGDLEFGGYCYNGRLTFSVAQTRVVAYIPMYGVWRSGRIRTCHERL